MKRLSFLRTLLVVLTAAVPLLVAAAGNARVTVLHGIRGQDLGLPAELPVDVYVNNALAIEDFVFGGQVTVDLPAGTYAITITLANDPNPVIEAAVPVGSRERATIVAHLNAGGAPTASKVTARATRAPRHLSVGQFVHAAAAPAVDGYFKFGNWPPLRLIRGLENGSSKTLLLNPDATVVAVTPAGSRDIVLGPADISPLLQGGKAYQFFVVGSVAGAAGNSLTVLRVEL
jgi:hypothetical protein